MKFDPLFRGQKVSVNNPNHDFLGYQIRSRDSLAKSHGR